MSSLNANSDAGELKIAHFDQHIVPKLEKLSARLAAEARPEFASFLNKAMARAQRFLRSELVARDFRALERNAPGALPEELHDRLLDFRDRGYSEFHKSELARRAWAMTWAERRLLQLKAKRTRIPHCVMSLHISSPAYRMLKQMSEESGLVEFVSAYTGKEMEFWYAALDHAHSGQDWYKACYADIGLPTPKTVYMHYDADFDLIKALFYLKDVGPGDGPFRFVPGSHKWRRSNPDTCSAEWLRSKLPAKSLPGKPEIAAIIARVSCLPRIVVRISSPCRSRCGAAPISATMSKTAHCCRKLY